MYPFPVQAPETIHPRKLTWIPKMMVWKRCLSFNICHFFGIYVRFLQCSFHVFSFRSMGSSSRHIPPVSWKPNLSNKLPTTGVVILPTQPNTALFKGKSSKLPYICIKFDHIHPKWVPFRDPSTKRHLLRKPLGGNSVAPSLGVEA